MPAWLERLCMVLLLSLGHCLWQASAIADATNPDRKQPAVNQDRKEPNPLVAVLKTADPAAARDGSGEVLPQGAVQGFGSTRFKVPGWWRRLAFAGNDEWIWIKADNQISVIHRETGRIVKQKALRLGNGSVRCVSATADGARVAIGLIESTRPGEAQQATFRVVVLSALTTSHVHDIRWTTSASDLKGACLSGDGQMLLTATEQGDIRLWNLDKNTFVSPPTLDLWNSRLRGVCLSASGQEAILACENHLSLWSSSGTGSVIDIESPDNHSVCLAPDGKKFATVSDDGARIRDSRDGRILAHLKSPDVESYRNVDFGIAWTPDGSTLAVPASSQNRIELWNTEMKKRVAVLPVRHPRGLAISRDGRWLAASSDQSTTEIFDLRLQKSVNPQHDGHTQPIFGVQFAGNESLVTSSIGATLIWSLRTGKIQQTLAHDHPDKIVLGLSVSPDGSTVVTSSADDSVNVWDRIIGTRLFKLKGHGERGGVRLVQFRPDGLQFVSWGDDLVLRWWNVRNGSLMVSHDFGQQNKLGPVQRGAFATQMTCAITADAAQLIVAKDGQIFEFDTISGQLLRQSPVSNGAEPLVISPNGRWIANGETYRDERGSILSSAVVLRDRKSLAIVREWSVADPHLAAFEQVLVNGIARRNGEASRLAQNGQGMAFSQDSRMLAWSRVDARPGVDIVEIDRDQLMASIPMESDCSCVRFSADGLGLATGHSDSTATVWQVQHPGFALRPIVRNGE